MSKARHRINMNDLGDDDDNNDFSDPFSDIEEEEGDVGGLLDVFEEMGEHPSNASLEQDLIAEGLSIIAPYELDEFDCLEHDEDFEEGENLVGETPKIVNPDDTL